jgi:uncharacterized membrane protein
MGSTTLPTVAPAPAAIPAPPVRARLDNVDAVRGLVMVLMALDHVRDMMQSQPYRATDLTWTTPVLFASRLVTHLCAPVFILLAGTGIYLAQRRKAHAEMVRFLVTRGLWLVVLELTVFKFFWYQTLDYTSVEALVIWTIGWCMVLMSAMVFLPTPLVAGLGLLFIFGHNLADGIVAGNGSDPVPWDSWSALWAVMHSTERVRLGEHSVLSPPYVILPWFGVMCAGYGLGALLTLDRPVRRRWIAGLGLAMIVVFVIIRGLNGYGDPHPWAVQIHDPDTETRYDPSQPEEMRVRQQAKLTSAAVPNPLYTVMSFVNTTKYPPSLDFLLMTLGPAHLILAALDRPLGPVAEKLVVYGRVPFFYYAVHLSLIGVCAGTVYAVGYARGWWDAPFQEVRLRGMGLSLAAAYCWWLVVVVVLYYPCRWFAGVKARSRAAWLSYL